MRVVKKRDIIREARDRWLQQYGNCPDQNVPAWQAGRDGATYGEIRQALRALDLETCPSTAIDSALGAIGWADNTCDECGLDHEVLLRIGQEPDYEARWWDLCRDCLTRAVVTLEPYK